MAQITESAIDFLTKGNNKGFFLMVEGGKIDWACHANDAATVFNEVKDMDNAIKVAYEFYKKQQGYCSGGYTRIVERSEKSGSIEYQELCPETHT